ncbi:CoA transferase [Dermatobacter hominis]|uniref:CoA transferase n=1 Tax=Dermatobacter hominis TaxID=2884263 RepID=UPI001D1098E1|nr:CoA transferase [Dermatobacter hominis]UDY36622.1 CoA transferase [Dermatobacter hominis]
MASTTAPEERDLDARRRWAGAGLAELTGAPDGPALGPPAGLVPRLDVVIGRIGRASEALGRVVEVDGLAELAMRTGELQLRRRGRVSCGGACHLVRAVDGWLAVSLARPDDWSLLPAWLGLDGGEADRWPEVHERCAGRSVGELVAAGSVLGLPLAALPAAAPPPTRVPGADPVAATGAARTAPSARRADDLVVVDLSSMWAGPLCGAVLARAGARVLKVESAGRRDGARRGPVGVWDHLNGAKEDVVVDVSDAVGRDELIAVLRRADVVVEASRPRALAQLGIDVDRILAADGGPAVWVSITGHGRRGRAAERVAFGDDAAVGGGLVARWEGDPVFCADAVADPLTGLVAAAGALEALAAGRRGLLDVPMVAVAAHFAAYGPTGGPPAPEPVT